MDKISVDSKFERNNSLQYKYRTEINEVKGGGSKGPKCREFCKKNYIHILYIYERYIFYKNCAVKKKLNIGKNG